MDDQPKTRTQLIAGLVQLDAIIGLGNKPVDYTETDVQVVAELADIAWDIVLRKRVEVARQASEAKYRQLFAEMSSGCALHEIMCDDAGNPVDYITLEVNTAFEALLDTRRDYVIGQRASNILPPEELNQWLELFGPVALTGRSNRYEMYSPLNQKYFEGSIYCPEKGKFAVIFTDVTERKRTEVALRTSEARFRALIDSTDDIILALDREQRHTGVFGRWLTKSNLTPEFFLGKTARDIFGAEGAAIHEAANARALAGESVIYEWSTAQPDRVAYYQTSVSPLYDQGEIVGVVGIGRDITERKRAEAAQAKLEAQLRQAQKMESIGRLAGGVAHDFNNLLTAILGHSSLMQAEMSTSDPLFSDLEQIRQAAERAGALTRQLLIFSRQQPLAPVIIDLNSLVANLDRMLKRLIGEDITLTTVLQPNLWPILADSGQMEQVIMNLVVNARDAMPTGGMLTIETSNICHDESYTNSHPGTPTGPSVLLAVTDTGCGMDEATLSQIFEPFFTTKEIGKGTGLGLATVYGIVKQSRGDISVYSEPGRGTSFKISLPAGETSPPVVTPEPRPTIRRGSETILLVEDEPMVRSITRVALQTEGYTILEVGHGDEALALAAQRERPIDLLLTDLVMPGMNGRELAERLKGLWPAVKVLFMSGYTDDTVARYGVLTGEVEFLAKPFSVDRLVARVRQVLDR